ncbi:MAG: hypothetical protein EOP48_14115 [Sphingobacteriales bacterium]|nr:MAG: hypothetical protein EOP48_14115 [Sphingobacteriales bacterium]
MKVVNAAKGLRGDCTVRCETKIGEITGKWRSESSPDLHHTYDIEVNFPPIQVDQIKVTDLLSRCVYDTSNDMQDIAGVIEAIDDDGLLYLRLSSDWLQMIELKHFELYVGMNIRLTCKASEIEIWPIGI